MRVHDCYMRFVQLLMTKGSRAPDNDDASLPHAQHSYDVGLLTRGQSVQLNSECVKIITLMSQLKILLLIHIVDLPALHVHVASDYLIAP